MTTDPTAAEVEAAARALHSGYCSGPCQHPNPGWKDDVDDARAALAAVLPDHDARLREQIAGEIEAVAPPAQPDIGRALYGDDMYGNGMRAAAWIARGKR